MVVEETDSTLAVQSAEEEARRDPDLFHPSEWIYKEVKNDNYHDMTIMI
jgi:hypothetical protein